MQPSFTQFILGLLGIVLILGFSAAGYRWYRRVTEQELAKHAQRGGH